MSDGDGQVFVGTLSLDVGHKISQTRVYFDRSSNFLFALAVDDVVSKTTTTASRRRDETTCYVTSGGSSCEKLLEGLARFPRRAVQGPANALILQAKFLEGTNRRTTRRLRLKLVRGRVAQAPQRESRA
jgi:hypothetical protein